jgi:hypothetical protein
MAAAERGTNLRLSAKAAGLGLIPAGVLIERRFA